MIRNLLIASFVFFLFTGYVGADVERQKECVTVGRTLGNYPDASEVCCSGLKARNLKIGYQGKCDMANAPGGYAAVCLACGNHVCDKELENKCNCPEDCNTY
jgi:hypothetical protein